MRLMNDKHSSDALSGPATPWNSFVWKSVLGSNTYVTLYLVGLHIVFNASEPVVEAIEKTEATESTENQNITDQGVGSNSNPGANIQDNSNAPARQEATKPAENNTNKPRGENASKDKDGITTTGQEIIDSMTSKLDSKLSLSAEQNKSISQILQKSLTDSGLSLSGEYTHEKSRTIGQDLIKNSSQAIAKVLDKDQSERFKKFRNK